MFLLTTHSPCSVLLIVCVSRFEESCGRKYGPFPPLYPPKPHPHPVPDFLRQQVIQTFCSNTQLSRITDGDSQFLPLKDGYCVCNNERTVGARLMQNEPQWWMVIDHVFKSNSSQQPSHRSDRMGMEAGYADPDEYSRNVNPNTSVHSSSAQLTIVFLNRFSFPGVPLLSKGRINLLSFPYGIIDCKIRRKRKPTSHRP